MASILLVDDEEDLRELTAALLAMHGHEVRTCHDGLEALRAVSERFPEIVISDVQMPVLDGPAMALHLFVDDVGREKIPIILMSGAPGVAKIAASVGTPYFLAKPIVTHLLLKLVDRALKEVIPPRPPALTHLE